MQIIIHETRFTWAIELRTVVFHQARVFKAENHFHCGWSTWIERICLEVRFRPLPSIGPTLSAWSCDPSRRRICSEIPRCTVRSIEAALVAETTRDVTQIWFRRTIKASIGGEWLGWNQKVNLNFWNRLPIGRFFVQITVLPDHCVHPFVRQIFLCTDRAQFGVFRPVVSADVATNQWIDREKMD